MDMYGVSVGIMRGVRVHIRDASEHVRDVNGLVRGGWTHI